jgi:predicted Zn-dependent protease
MPALSNLPLILRGKEAEQIFAWFFENARTEAIYSKASMFEIGATVQGEGAIEPLELWAEPIIPGLPASSNFDDDGFPLTRMLVIEGGILKTLIGSIRHADWLGVPRNGAFKLFSVPGGSMSIEEFRAQPYLEPVMFSDFRLDPVTGDFGAEVRLAYYFDGTALIPVTGGSVSGSLRGMRTTMRRSRETAIVTRSSCPIAVRLEGALISG